MVVALLGILSGILMAYAALPQAIRTIRARKSLGVPVDVSFVVVLGTITTYLYLLLSYGFNLLIAINFGIGALCWAILLFYGVFKNAATK